MLAALLIALAAAAPPAEDLEPGAAPLPAGLALSMPFPEGVELKVSCDYGPRCTWSHDRTDDPDDINDFYALDLIRNQVGNGRGQPVTAAAAGEVVSAGWATGERGIYGRVVVLRHEGGDGHNTFSAYAHLATILVEEGQRVTIKQPVGLMGGSSWFTDDRLAPHVHFAVYRDIDVVDGLPSGGRSVRPEPIDGYRGLVAEQVLVAGDGARAAVYVTVDDADPGFSVSGASAAELESYETVPNPWVQWSYGHPEAWTDSSGYGGWTRVLATPARPAGDPLVVGRWTPALPRAGDYRVQVYAAASSGMSATGAVYTVHTAAGPVSCPVDQSAGQGGWLDLCQGRTFALADGAAVSLADDTGDISSRRVGFDAVRFILQTPPRTPK